ncbi:MAG TPA: maleylpyruvate isomerase N-terminal domain-containing protein [Nocardioidaceae bacterium]|nr:maleylpyruvate isomerase N-terminal domain-containing protein [Nocardioidaceae bacterium]
MTEELADDLDTALRFAVATLSTAIEHDWQTPARDLRWTCWETLEHVADDLFSYAGQIVAPTTGMTDYVPFVYDSVREGGPECTIRSQPAQGNAGLLDVVTTCGALLSSAVRTAPSDRRGWHPYGVSDPGGFAAMGTVETLVHVYDVAEALRVSWEPTGDVVRRALDRLFPHAPSDTEPWPALLWATGRIPLTDRPRRTAWRWDSTVRSG